MTKKRRWAMTMMATIRIKLAMTEAPWHHMLLYFFVIVAIGPYPWEIWKEVINPHDASKFFQCAERLVDLPRGGRRDEYDAAEEGSVIIM